MPDAAARIAEHPRAVCHDVWLGRAAASSRSQWESGGAEGRQGESVTDVS